MKSSISIIIANASLKNGNRGCVALSISTIYIIDKILTDVGINYKLYLLDDCYQDSQKDTIKIGNRCITYHQLAYCLGTNIKENLRIAAEMIYRRNDTLKIFRNADYILDIGQGDSFSDIYGEKRFKQIDNIHRIARFFHTPYCLLPQTIGPFSSPTILQAALKSIKQATLCMARDKRSYEFVKSYLPTLKNFHEYIDIAFFLPYNRITQEAGYTHVGINVSALLWNGGYTRNNQFELFADYQRLIRIIIDSFLSQEYIKVHLVPHVVSSERHIENDYAVSYDLWREYSHPNLVIAPLALGPIEIKSYIAGLDFFMGARMHATIGAFSAGVPVVPMAYSRKFNGLFFNTLSYNHMVDMKTMGNDEILATIKSAFDKRDILKREIEYQMDTTVKEKKQLIMDKLNEFFNIQ